MKIKEFKFLTLEDKSDSLYSGNGTIWSRPYEYPFVLNCIKVYSNNTEKIHNTSWGYEGVHIIFKNELDKLYDCVHSDIKQSKYPKTKVWDIKQPPNDEELNYYDVVINVSTIEEVKGNHVEIIKNLLSMVKPGGILIVTMDVPGAQLEKITQWIGVQPKYSEYILTGNNSAFQNSRYGDLSVVGLVIEKN